jgi:hypothetical protein
MSPTTEKVRTSPTSGSDAATGPGSEPPEMSWSVDPLTPDPKEGAWSIVRLTVAVAQVLETVLQILYWNVSEPNGPAVT